MTLNNKKKNAADDATRKQKIVQVEEGILGLLDEESGMTAAKRKEFDALMKASGALGRALRVSKKTDTAGDFGDRLHEQTLAMIEAAHEMTLAASSSSPLDPDDLLKRIKRVRDMPSLEAEMKQQAEWQQKGCPAEQRITVGKPLKLKQRRP